MKKEKKKILTIGSCVTTCMLSMLKIVSIFEERKTLFDRLPWNFFDEPIVLDEADGEKVWKIKYYLRNLVEGEIEGADYVLIDLYSLFKPTVKVKYKGRNKTIVANIILCQELDRIPNLSYEVISVEDKFVYESLEKFSRLLKEKYLVNQLIIIRPKLVCRYLNDNYEICHVSQEETDRRKKLEDKLYAYTDYLIEQLGSGALVCDIPNDVVGENQNNMVHYLQSDYIRIEEKILNLMEIDYKNYWKNEINPNDLIYEHWIKKSNQYFAIAKAVNNVILNQSCENLINWTIPGRMKRECVGLESKTSMMFKILLQCKKDKKWICFGAGKNCQMLLESYMLPINFILDNDSAKVGKEINGIPISSPIEIDDWNQYFIIVTCAQSTEIEHQLNSYGLYKNEDYILLTELM